MTVFQGHPGTDRPNSGKRSMEIFRGIHVSVSFDQWAGFCYLRILGMIAVSRLFPDWNQCLCRSHRYSPGNTLIRPLCTYRESVLADVIFWPSNPRSEE